MYENAGRSIKNVVSIVVLIGYAVSVLGAIAIFIIGLTTGSIGMAILYSIVAIVVGVLGCLGAWLGGLWLYAYGEITDCLISIDAKMQKLPQSKEDTPAPVSVSHANGSAVRTTAPSPSVHTAVPSPSVRADVSMPGGWTCSCGRVHAPYVTTCTCGINKREIQQ